MTIGEFIKLKRNEIGISQAALYKAAFGNTDRSDGGRLYISRLERDKTRLTFEQFLAITNGLGVNPCEFLVEYIEGENNELE